MTVNDIFSDMATHMIKGVMTHEQLMNSYRFLGFSGYGKLHEYHYLEETEGYIKLCKYAIERLEFLIKPGRVEDPAIIPESWYSVRRLEVPSDTKLKAVVAGFDEWLSWETQALDCYRNAYEELLGTHEVDVAEFVKEYVVSTSEEIIYIKNEIVVKESMSYDMISIVEEQSAYEKNFEKKIRKLKGA